MRAAQQRHGAREHNERMAQRPPERDVLPEEMQARIANANSVIIGTASLEGWPHLQHRGGPRGFIKVLGPRSLAFADYAGNRQYITIGNLAENDRIFLLLIDYAARTRLKIWGRGRWSRTIPACWNRFAIQTTGPGGAGDPHRRRSLGHQLQQPYPASGAG